MSFLENTNTFFLNTEPLKMEVEINTTDNFQVFNIEANKLINFFKKEIEKKIKELSNVKINFFYKFRLQRKYLKLINIFDITRKNVSKPNLVPSTFIQKNDNSTQYLIYAVNKFLSEESNKTFYYIRNILIKLNYKKNYLDEFEEDIVLSKDNIFSFFDKYKNLNETKFNIVIDSLIFNNLKINLPKILKIFSKTKENLNKDFEQFFNKYKKSKNIKKLCDIKSKEFLKNFFKKYKFLQNKYENLFRKLDVKTIEILEKTKTKIKKDKKTKMFPLVQTPYIIDLQNVYKYYSNGVVTNKVLDNVDLQLNPGDFIVILGPSGSGKTTLLNIISGMDRATIGKTIVANVNLINLDNTQLTEFRRQNVGYIFQQYGLLPNLTVRENIEIGAFLQPDSEKRLNIDKLLKDTGMYEYKNRLPSELSGGQQQRVSILRAIAKNPKIIFADEPTGALDEEMTQIVLDQFIKVNREYKTTIILVTHNPLIAELASCVIRVHNGKIKSVTRNEKIKEVSEINWSAN
ncbi:ABC transporter ATP-binding protein [Mycoplasmoides pirum]|uniref:ABC transporter ATP-binding protein n=1 Tax=Mycoplasmoides pirum TaxID=2122 RepID=UPI000697BD1E|nr:ABC transporter ATP-binding protein [Mycoplasmoides pirum]